MSNFHDHDVVETPSGTYPVLPDTDEIVPIHWVDSKDVLMPGGCWTHDALEAVLGTPGQYASRIVRLFAVLPDQTVDDLDLSGMANMLGEYAALHGISIKVTYFPNANAGSKKMFFNYKSNEQHWVSIDLLTNEILSQMVTAAQDPGSAVMYDMHIHPGDAYLDRGWKPLTTDIDVDAMAPNCGLMFPRNTYYDYNTLVVHRVADGEHTRVEYPIGMTGFRAL